MWLILSHEHARWILIQSLTIMAQIIYSGDDLLESYYPVMLNQMLDLAFYTHTLGNLLSLVVVTVIAYF